MLSNLKIDKKEIWPLARLALILLAITAVVAMLLAVVNEVTRDPIAKGKEKALKEGMAQVLVAESYEPVANLADLGVEEIVTEAYVAKKGGETVGYCIKSTPSGYGGAIEIITGIDAEGKVSGVKIISMAETAGVGTKTNDAEWLSQFNGKSGTVLIISQGDPAEDEVSAISGATISSKAVTAGVNASINAVGVIKGAA